MIGEINDTILLILVFIQDTTQGVKSPAILFDQAVSQGSWSGFGTWLQCLAVCIHTEHKVIPGSTWRCCSVRTYVGSPSCPFFQHVALRSRGKVMRKGLRIELCKHTKKIILISLSCSCSPISVPLFPPFHVHPPCRPRAKPISPSCPCTNTQVSGTLVCSLSSSLLLCWLGESFCLERWINRWLIP